MLVFFGMKKAHAWEPSILTHLTRICLFLILFRYLTAPLPYKVLRKPLKQPLCPTKYILWCEFVRGGTRNQTQERSPWFRQPYVLPTLEALTAETLGIGKRTVRNVHHSLRKQRMDWVSKETAIWLCPDNQNQDIAKCSHVLFVFSIRATSWKRKCLGRGKWIWSKYTEWKTNSIFKKCVLKWLSTILLETYIFH